MKRTLLIFSALALVACNGGGSDIAEQMSAMPTSIEADCELGTYNIDLSANCAWTAVAAGDEGTAVSWITLGKTQGKSNAAVSVRVQKNSYNTQRSSTITFTSASGKTTAKVVLTQKASSQGEDPAEITSRIGTYNIRMSNLDSGDNAWDKRKDRLFSSIDACAFDIFGVQEVSTTAQADLKAKYGSSYGCYFFSPYSQNGIGDKAHGVLYRSNLFTISDIHNFWMGPDPMVMSKSDTGSSGDFCRGGFCCILTHKGTGIKLFFMCTHGCLNDAPNAQYAPIYAQMEKRYNTEGLPSVFVGDMNASPTSAPYLEYVKHWKDSFIEASSKSGCANTYNGFKSPNGSSRIDDVFYRGKAVPGAYCCDNALYGGLYASDHFPVYVDFKISK